MTAKKVLPATLLLLASIAAGPATRPTSQPTPLPADELLKKMLRPDQAAEQALKPSPNADIRDITSGRGAAAPNAPIMPLLREGTFLIDRSGRLSRNGDANAPEFAFDSDGRALRDPPMMILPNNKLVLMEDAVKSASKDLRFRITGMITEYRGRNLILIEKVVVIPDVAQGNISQGN